VLAAPPSPGSNGLYGPSPPPPPYSPLAGQPIIFFDGYANTTLAISKDVPRAGSHLIVEAFPTSPGTATVQVVDANGQAGQLTNVTDSNGVRSSISAYTKFMVKGVMERVAIKLTVSSGAWSVWGTFTDQASDRAIYYDRAPTPKTFEYNAGGVGPHSFTQRWSYTVPASRKAFLEYVGAWVNRVTAASSVGNFSVEVRYTPSGGSFSRILFMSVADNTLQKPYVYFPTQFGYMGPGDVVTGNTQDASTGGTVDYNVGMKVTEYDI
jgi:hypothetical protein